MLDIGLSELLNTKYVKDAISELDSSMDGDESNIPLSDAHGDSKSPNATIMIGLGRQNFERSLRGLRGVARLNSLGEVFELWNTSLYVD